MGLTPDQQKFNLLIFGYSPNTAAPIVVMVCFLLLAIATAIQNWRLKCWYMFIVSVTAIAEFVGFFCRYQLAAVGAGKTMLIVMELALILSPNALALVNYMTVGRIVLNATKIQGFGAGMSTNENMSFETVKGIMMTGLALQMGFFSIFAIITIYVHMSPRFHLRPNLGIRNAFICLYLTIGLITIRSIYRFIEFSTPKGNYITTHEWPFYVFDTAVVLGCMVAYFIVPFGKYIYVDLSILLIEPGLESVSPKLLVA